MTTTVSIAVVVEIRLQDVSPVHCTVTLHKGWMDEQNDWKSHFKMALSFVMFKTPLNLGSLQLVLLLLTAGRRSQRWSMRPCSAEEVGGHESMRWGGLDTKVCSASAGRSHRPEESANLFAPFKNEQPKLGQIDPQIGIKNIPCNSYEFWWFCVK